MPKPGSSQEEDEFRKALHKPNVGGAIREWVPMLGSGVVALGALLLIFTMWPMASIPVIVLLGIPLAAGIGAFVVLKKAMG